MLGNFLIIFIYTMVLEIFFRLASNIKILDTSIFRVAIGYAIISVIISFILSYFNKKISNIVIILVSFIFTIYAFLQMGFNNFIGVYMSVNTSSQLGAVVDYVREFLASFLPIYYIIFIPFAFLIAFYVIKRLVKKENYDENRKFLLKKRTKYEYQIRALSTLIIVGILSFGYYESLKVKFMQNEMQVVSNWDLFKNPNVPSIVVNEFGVLGFGVLDIKSAIIEPEEDMAVINVNNKTKENTNRQIDDTLWEAVIADEKDKTLQSINNYLINQDIPDYNEFTGMFEGKNLIVIMMESANNILINKEYYPNFYKLYTEGWAFENNYSPRNSCSTGNNEFSGMTGLYSIYNNCTANKYRTNTYSTSIFNLFNNKDYQTMSMHDYTEAYYYRRTIHRNLGSGRYYGVQDLGIEYFTEYRNWASDEDFMNAAMDIIEKRDKSKPFMTWLTTVSSHQPYVVPSVEGDKHMDMFADTDYPTDLKRYMSKLKTLDNALGILLDRLEKDGLLDDTVIALYGDHYPYGLANKTLNYVLEGDLSEYEVERVPFVIYNSEMTPKKYSQYTSYVNLTPTLANLFDLDYDPRLYMGSDILSKSYESRVVFADGSWKNADAYYDASKGALKNYTDRVYSLEEIKEINSIINAKTQMSTLIIRNNYFADLQEKMTKKQTELEEQVASPATDDYLANAELGG